MSVGSVEKYYEEAKIMLDEKDSMAFMENISYAIILSSNEMKLYSKVVFLKAKGLFLLKEYDKALKTIEEALNYNKGVERIKLLKYKGLILNYRGFFKQAIIVFKDLLTQTDDINEKTGLHINLAGVYLSMYRAGEDQSSYLDEALLHLKEAKRNFDSVNSNKKKLICINYGEYYYLIGNYEEAIDMQKKAVQYCIEKDLPEAYNNLAELYLIIDDLAQAEDYLHDVELLAEKHKNHLEIAKGFYTTAKIEIKNQEYLKAIDSLYMALDFFIDAEALTYAFNCFNKIIAVSKQFDNVCVNSIKKGVKGYFKDTPFYEKM